MSVEEANGLDKHGDPLVCRPGEVFASYEITRFVMSGGVCQLYEATHQLLDRRVAIKVEKARLRSDPTRARRILSEARALALLDHPNVLRILHADTDPRIGVFMVMELLEGRDLGELLLVFRAARRPIAVDMAVSIAVQLTDALDAFHRLGVLHRDLNPHNIFIMRGDDGARSVKLLDLGLAKFAGSVSEDGVMVGSLPYMAPEQMRHGRASHRTEVFSVGLLLYEMLAGQHPFSHDKPGLEHPAAVALRTLSAPLAPVNTRRPEVSPALTRVLARALALQPEHRQGSMMELRRELEAALLAPAAADAAARRSGGDPDPTEPLGAFADMTVPGSGRIAPHADLVPTVRMTSHAALRLEPDRESAATIGLPPFACELGAHLLTPSLVLIEAPGAWRFMRVPVLGAVASRRPRETRLGAGGTIPIPGLPTVTLESDTLGQVMVLGPVQRQREGILEPYDTFRCGPYVFQLVPPTPDGVGVPIDYATRSVPRKAPLTTPSLLVRAGAIEAVDRKLPLTRRASFVGGAVDVDVPLFGCPERVVARVTVLENTGELEVAGAAGADVRLHGVFAAQGRLGALEWFGVAGWELVYLPPSCP